MEMNEPIYEIKIFGAISERTIQNWKDVPRVIDVLKSEIEELQEKYKQFNCEN